MTTAHSDVDMFRTARPSSACSATSRGAPGASPHRPHHSSPWDRCKPRRLHLGSASRAPPPHKSGGFNGSFSGTVRPGGSTCRLESVTDCALSLLFLGFQTLHFISSTSTTPLSADGLARAPRFEMLWVSWASTSIPAQ